MAGWLVYLVGKHFHLEVISHYGGRGEGRKGVGGNWRTPEKNPDAQHCGQDVTYKVSRREVNPDFLTADVLTTTLPGAPEWTQPARNLGSLTDHMQGEICRWRVPRFPFT